MGAYTRNDTDGIAQDLAMVFDLFPRLKERTKQLGGSLSGGEQQMLAIGRGLMARPKLLLLDEPSLGLAPKIVSDIFAVLHRINMEGTTMLIVEQNVHVALKNTSEAYVLQVGKVACSGASAELRRTTRSWRLTWAFAHDGRRSICPGKRGRTARLSPARQAIPGKLLSQF
jgi:branched-chain amino acid transport system ATP-binding protein